MYIDIVLSPNVCHHRRLQAVRCMDLFGAFISVLHMLFCRFDESSEGLVLFPFVQV